MQGQKQSPRAGEESSLGSPVVLSEALAAKISDLRERAKVDIETLRRTATQPAVLHTRDQVPQFDTSVAQLTARLKALRAEVDRLRTELTLTGEDGPLPPPPAPGNVPSQVDRRALLITLNMASNGASRSEAADYLAENLNLRDCDELLGAVYSYVASTRPGPRETKSAP